MPKRTSNNKQVKDMFPINIRKGMNTRRKEKYMVQKAHTNRLKKSAIPYMQNLLNEQKYF